MYLFILNPHEFALSRLEKSFCPCTNSEKDITRFAFARVANAKRTTLGLSNRIQSFMETSFLGKKIYDFRVFQCQIAQFQSLSPLTSAVDCHYDIFHIDLRSFYPKTP